MKLKITILFNSGIEKSYIMLYRGCKNPMEEDLQKSIGYMQDEMISVVYQNSIGGCLSFEDIDGNSVSLNLPQTSSIVFSKVD